MVETDGFEPTTSCMSSMRSNQLSYASAPVALCLSASAEVCLLFRNGYIISHFLSDCKGFCESFFRFFGFFSAFRVSEILIFPFRPAFSSFRL